jgi:hypothetical protein
METPKTKTKIRSFEIWTYDVWGNAEDGFEVNDLTCIDRNYKIRCKAQTYNVGTPHQFTVYEVTDAQIKRVAREVFGFRCELDIDGDDRCIYVRRAKDWYPLFEMLENE